MIYGMHPQLNEELCEKFLQAHPQYRKALEGIPALLKNLATSYAHPKESFWHGNRRYTGFQEFLDQVSPEDDLHNIQLLFIENYRFSLKIQESQRDHLRKIVKYLPLGIERDSNLVHLFQRLLQWALDLPEEEIPETPDQWDFCFAYAKMFYPQSQEQALQNLQEIRKQMGGQAEKKDTSLVTAYANYFTELQQITKTFHDPRLTAEILDAQQKVHANWQQIQEVAEKYLQSQGAPVSQGQEKPKQDFLLEVQELHLNWLQESKKAMERYQTFLEICPFLPKYPAASSGKI